MHDATPPHSPADPRSGTSYSIKEAAQVCGVSTDTIKRRLSDGRFPTAHQRPGRTGPEWRIDAGELVKVAAEDDWDLNLASAEPQQTGGFEKLLQTVQGDTAALVDAQARLGQSQFRTEQLEKELIQAKTDLEHWHSEHDRRIAEAAELQQAKAVAEARTEEVRTQLTKTEQQVSTQTQLLAERDAELVSMGDRYREAENQASERASADAEALDEAARRLSGAEQAMGWWSRRRYEKAQP